MEEQQPNPFATPTTVSDFAASTFDPDLELKPFALGRSIFKWVLICGISGAPSFVLAFSLGENVYIQAFAMLMGILTYAGVYVYVESLEWTRRKLMDKSLKIAVRIGYVTRIAISIIFPLAFFIDIWCGLLSVSFTSAIFGEPQLGSSRIFRGNLATLPIVFLWFYTTTIVQGALLNIVLGGYTLVVYGITLLVRGGNKA